MSLIGFSRPYLGAHYFSDVAGGFAAGGAWLSAVITGWEAMRQPDVATWHDDHIHVTYTGEFRLLD